MRFSKIRIDDEYLKNLFNDYVATYGEKFCTYDKESIGCPLTDNEGPYLLLWDGMNTASETVPVHLVDIHVRGWYTVRVIKLSPYKLLELYARHGNDAAVEIVYEAYLRRREQELTARSMGQVFKGNPGVIHDPRLGVNSTISEEDLAGDRRFNLGNVKASACDKNFDYSELLKAIENAQELPLLFRAVGDSKSSRWWRKDPSNPLNPVSNESKRVGTVSDLTTSPDTGLITGRITLQASDMKADQFQSIVLKPLFSLDGSLPELGWRDITLAGIELLDEYAVAGSIGAADPALDTEPLSELQNGPRTATSSWDGVVEQLKERT